MENLYSSQMPSPIGDLTLTVSERGLLAINWAWTKLKRNARHQLERSDEEAAPYIGELQEYFSGKRREFTFPLDLRGTDFQQRCWQALLAIPYGETRSYAAIARAVGSPRGFRAVGQANHHNPIPIVVPCHRVLTSAGMLGGYGGGLDIKEKLLRLEGVVLKKEPRRNNMALAFEFSGGGSQVESS